MKEKHLTPKQLSERWNVPLATLSQWRWNGLGPDYMKLGRHIAYRLREIERFEAEKLRRNTACSVAEYISQEQERKENEVKTKNRRIKP
ncbi:MAG: DNA-binding protein [Alphaproteobacteria bacterium]|jgi:hypothetical protein|nr:DNA-binding protein [Alphaproteobacteria bacterium]